MLIQGVDSSLWAHAIAVRLADEFHSDFEEDRDTLEHALELSLNNSYESVLSLIGTGIIEQDYFESLD